jgi:PadR family transcriptional regulator, regulatory protein AphA
MPILTPTAAIVLGLVERAGEATPYELKQALAATVGNFWSLPHSQLYAEPERLAAAGLLEERRESEGRRRRLFRLTDRGREALARWREEPVGDELPELRDLALLKLFFGADPKRIAPAQLAAHRTKLAAYESLKAVDPGVPPRGGWLTLDAGIGHEREWVAFWERVLEEPSGSEAP